MLCVRPKSLVNVWFSMVIAHFKVFYAIGWYSSKISQKHGKTHCWWKFPHCENQTFKGKYLIIIVLDEWNSLLNTCISTICFELTKKRVFLISLYIYKLALYIYKLALHLYPYYVFFIYCFLKHADHSV